MQRAVKYLRSFASVACALSFAAAAFGVMVVLFVSIGYVLVGLHYLVGLVLDRATNWFGYAGMYGLLAVGCGLLLAMFFTRLLDWTEKREQHIRSRTLQQMSADPQLQAIYEEMEFLLRQREWQRELPRVIRHGPDLWQVSMSRPFSVTPGILESVS